MLAQPPIERHQVGLGEALKPVCGAAHPGSLIYLISDFMDISPNFEKEPSLSRLNKSCDVVLISINDPADRALVPAGVIGFCGEDKVYINTDDRKGCETYAAQWEANRKTLNALVERWKIPLIGLSTESDMHRDLLLGLKNIAKRKKCLL